jgi:pimeloyl-ACP methyl ester carboxylesterase
MLLMSVLWTPAMAACDEPDAWQQMERNAWYLPTGDGTADLYVTEVGRGTPVVFLHGGPGNDFQYIVDAVAPLRCQNRFILFDQRGSLLSPVTPDKLDKVSFEALVDDLETLRLALGQDRLTLFGHSFGTLLAAGYYRAHPDHVERLILAGAIPARGTLSQFVATMRPVQKQLRERPEVEATLRREHLDGPRESLTPQQRSDRFRITGLASINIVDLDRWRSVPGGRVFYSSQLDDRIGDSIPSELGIEAAMDAHPVPIAIIQGDRDYVDPAGEGWQAIAREHPTWPISIHVMPNAGHYAWIDDPEAFEKALADGIEARDLKH